MAAVSVVILKVKKMEDNRHITQAQLNFGDGATTYPALGIPIPGAGFSCKRFVDQVDFEDDAGSSRIAKYDVANQKVRIFVETAGTYAEMTGVIPTFNMKCMVFGSN
jgi:hypothetical protein